MRIAVLCSGGDAPGMNACVRAVVRTAIASGHAVVGVCRGYAGLLAEDFYQTSAGGDWMTLRSVSGWSRFGGTFLHSSRCEEFKTEAGQTKAVEMLKRNGIDALVPIGGDGTIRGAIELGKRWDGQIVACPGTIDNDLRGTDFTIGFSTAVNTAVEAVDKIRDTAESHERMFLIEVMGRHSGYIAVYTALAAAAEIACIPETPTDFSTIIESLTELKRRRKKSAMVIVAEGDEAGGAEILNQQLIEANCPFSTRVVILGHLQRGGIPTPEDRIHSSIMGDAAVKAIIEGKSGLMAGIQNGAASLTPLEETIAGHKPIPQHLLDLISVLAH